MSVKIIGIGNTLMEDDGIGIRVIEKIRNQLEEIKLEVIVGETDFNYCISRINSEDLVIVIDAACYSNNPGEIEVFTIDNFITLKRGYTQHSYGLLEVLKLYYPNLKGYIIGIQINNVSFKLGLSKVLEGNLEDISKKVKNCIKDLI